MIEINEAAPMKTSGNGSSVIEQYNVLLERRNCYRAGIRIERSAFEAWPRPLA